jgi:hypothetical protein
MSLALVVVETLLETQGLCSMLAPSADPPAHPSSPEALPCSPMTRYGRTLRCRAEAPALVDVAAGLSELVRVCSNRGGDHGVEAGWEASAPGKSGRWRWVIARMFTSATACMAALASHQAAVLSQERRGRMEGRHGREGEEAAPVLAASAVLAIVRRTAEEALDGCDAEEALDGCDAGAGVQRAVGAAELLSTLVVPGGVHVRSGREAGEGGEGGRQEQAQDAALVAHGRLLDVLPAVCSRWAAGRAGGGTRGQPGVDHVGPAADAPGALRALRTLLKPLRLMAVRDGRSVYRLSVCAGGWGRWAAALGAALGYVDACVRRGGEEGRFALAVLGDLVDLTLAVPPDAWLSLAGDEGHGGPADGKCWRLGHEVARYSLRLGFRVWGSGSRLAVLPCFAGVPLLGLRPVCLCVLRGQRSVARQSVCRWCQHASK